MNEIPTTLEEAIKQLNELRSAYMARMEDIQELNTEITRLSALLPPEGETRGTIHDATEQIRIEALVRDSRGYYRINLTKVEEILHRYFAKPVPSSEKALREAYEQGLANMSANFPAAKEVIIDKVIDTIYKWSNEHEHQVTPPYDWAELGKRLRLLASPSPQVEDAGLREAVELIRAFIDETKAEGAQENHKQRALAYLITIEDYANKLRARLASAQSSAQGEEARKMREALAFYADPGTYRPQIKHASDTPQQGILPIMLDMGDKARAALERKEEE